MALIAFSQQRISFSPFNTRGSRDEGQQGNKCPATPHNGCLKSMRCGRIRISISPLNTRGSRDEGQQGNAVAVNAEDELIGAGLERCLGKYVEGSRIDLREKGREMNLLADDASSKAANSAFQDYQKIIKMSGLS